MAEDIVVLADRERVVKLEGLVERVFHDVQRVMTIIDGNGQPGLLTRLDRLERLSEARGRYMAGLLIAIVPLVVKVVYDWFRWR